MGRKRKSHGNKRHPCTVSLPLNIHSHFDKLSSTGITISRYIERLVNDDILNQQTTLIRQVWECLPCNKVWHTNNPSTDFALCKSCKKEANYISTLSEWEKKNEEEE